MGTRTARTRMITANAITRTRVITRMATMSTDGAAGIGSALSAPALLRLLQLVSPALPIGGYNFSQGLEYAVHAGWVHDEASALAWIRGLARNALGTLDLPVLLRLHAAADFYYWSQFAIASREAA